MYKYILSGRPMRTHPIYKFTYYKISVWAYKKRRPIDIIYDDGKRLKIIDVDEVSRLLNMHKTTIIRYIHDGVFVNIFKNDRDHHQYFLLESEVDEIKIYLKDFGKINRRHYKDFNKINRTGIFVIHRARLFDWPLGRND